MRYFWLLILPVLVTAQVPTQIINPCLSQSCFFASVSGTVAANGTSKLTIQQPATGGHQVTYIAAVVQCAGQTFTIDQAQNGTAATTTATARTALIPTVSTASALAFSASNSTGGTATAPTYSLPSGGPAVLNLTQRTTGLSGGTNNYSVTMTNTGTASCVGGVGIYWSEK